MKRKAATSTLPIEIDAKGQGPLGMPPADFLREDRKSVV